MIAVIIIVVVVFILYCIENATRENSEDDRKEFRQNQANIKNKTSKSTRDSHNNYFQIKDNIFIIHPDAIKQLGEAGAKMLQSGNAYYDRERGVFILKGKTKEQTMRKDLKQLLAQLADED